LNAGNKEEVAPSDELDKWYQHSRDAQDNRFRQVVTRQGIDRHAKSQPADFIFLQVMLNRLYLKMKYGRAHPTDIRFESV
jgi:hypothetical protein